MLRSNWTYLARTRGKPRFLLATPLGEWAWTELKMFCFRALHHWELREGEDHHNSLCFRLDRVSTSLPPYCPAVPPPHPPAQAAHQPALRPPTTWQLTSRDLPCSPLGPLGRVITNSHINTEISTDMHPILWAPPSSPITLEHFFSLPETFRS